MWCEYEIVIFEFTVNKRLGLKEDQGATVFGEGDPGSKKLQKTFFLKIMKFDLNFLSLEIIKMMRSDVTKLAWVDSFNLPTLFLTPPPVLTSVFFYLKNQIVD